MVASTHLVHSPQTYDRKPIVVSPNSCGLPQRGDRKLYSPPADFEVERRERGRGRGHSGAAGDHVKGSYFHPRAYEACEPEPLEVQDLNMSPPLLLADDYDSDSDEESVTTPPDPKLPIMGAAVSEAAKSTISSRPLTPYRSTYMCARGPQTVEKNVEGYQRPLLLQRRVVRLEQEDQLCGINEGCLGGF